MIFLIIWIEKEIEKRKNNIDNGVKIKKQKTRRTSKNGRNF